MKVVSGENISYKIRPSSRAKRLKIAVYHNGDVLVTKPRSISYGFAHKAVNRKLSWILDKIKTFKTKYPNAVPAHISRRNSRDAYLSNKERARAFIHNRVAELNRHYGFNYARITVKNHSTLWGSCSKKGNLNFNFRIVDLPAHVADYVIVHELCHLREFNHSKNFWALVAQTIPGHKKIRAELKTSNPSVQV